MLPHFSVQINSWLKRKAFDSESTHHSTLSHTHVCSAIASKLIYTSHTLPSHHITDHDLIPLDNLHRSTSPHFTHPYHAPITSLSPSDLPPLPYPPPSDLPRSPPSGSDSAQDLAPSAFMERLSREEQAMLSSRASIQHFPELCVGARKIRWAVGRSWSVAPGRGRG